MNGWTNINISENKLKSSGIKKIGLTLLLEGDKIKFHTVWYSVYLTFGSQKHIHPYSI